MSGIEWRSDFIDALEAMHPNADVRAGLGRNQGVVDKAGHVVHEWRAMQAEATRLAEENARLHALVGKLTGLVS